MRTASEEEHKAAEIAEHDEHSDALSRQESTISRNSSWSSLTGRSLMKKILSRRGSKSDEPEAEAMETEPVGEPEVPPRDKGKQKVERDS